MFVGEIEDEETLHPRLLLNEYAHLAGSEFGLRKVYCGDLSADRDARVDVYQLEDPSVTGPPTLSKYTLNPVGTRFGERGRYILCPVIDSGVKAEFV